ncbi:glucokinase [Extensimonas sp. H3M7-6]|uniref:glucokinase n=1 Tax=Extensimonas soli TaxID=3031322 RepID=UPI0023D9B4CB|nr:glucokinase [Extensimonas sp. H3M7-6]MDF1481530.1 glucokinase [Extensimonas sp. H3M7-6]
MVHMRLLADIGGTNIRLAWQAGPGDALHDLWVRPCAQFASLEAAIRAYVAEAGIAMPEEAALGIANPVTGDAVRMTNRDWSFSQSALRAALGLRRLVVLNDFTALALAIPLLTPQMLRQVGGGAPVAGTAVGLLGAGTGLGVSGLVFAPGGMDIPLAGEGGHATLAAQTPLEWELLCILQRRYGHVSAERVLSGQGLVDLYHALRERSMFGGTDVSQPEHVTALAFDAGDALALQALTLFSGFLGTVAGDLALTLGARGGVYLGGGIVPRLGAWFDQSNFRARFEAKGRFQAYLAPIPCWVINPDAAPALYGAARALDRPQCARN